MYVERQLCLKVKYLNICTNKIQMLRDLLVIGHTQCLCSLIDPFVPTPMLSVHIMIVHKYDKIPFL